MGKKNKRQDITFLNILFCLLVILIHISSEVITQMDRGHTLYWVVLLLSKMSAFVVQGFIMLSGVKLFLKAGNIHYGKFYLSRLTKVVIPYIIWVFIYYIYFCSKDYFVFSWAELGRFILNGKVSAHFYFVIVIVQFYLLAPVWVVFFKKANPAVVLMLSLLITVISGTSLDNIVATLFPNHSFQHLDLFFPRYLIYWVAGCMIGLHYQEFTNYLQKRWISITLLFAACSFIKGWFTVYFVGGGPIWMDQIHILYCISALLFFYMVSQVFVGRGAMLLTPFGWLDRYTYHIYLIHCLVIFMVNEWMTQKGITDYAVRLGWRTLFAYLGTILVCLIYDGVKNLILKLLKNDK